MTHSIHLFYAVLCILLASLNISCAQNPLWKTEEYFDDPQLIALCKAIDREDLAEMERLVKAGADVNARGKDGMTPLLWAYGAGEKALEKVLELGADPNTVYDNDFKSRGMIDPGDTLLFVAMKSTAPSNTRYAEKFQNYVDILLKYGADPNRVQKNLKTVPLRNAIRFNNVTAARKLILAGADVDARIDGKQPLLNYAANRYYDVMLVLLQHGADYRAIDPRNGLTTIQLIGGHSVYLNDPSKTGQDYREVVAWMETRGMSIERAKEQWELWQKKSVINGDYEGSRKKYIEEVVEIENARLLPPGAPLLAVQPPPPIAPVPPPVAKRDILFLVLVTLTILALLAGGIFLAIKWKHPWRGRRTGVIFYEL